MCKQVRVVILVVTMALLVIGGSNPGLVQGQAKPPNLPSFILIAVNPAGALLNTLGTGLAKMIGEKGPFDVKLRTTSGYTDTLANDGSVHLAMSVSVETHHGSGWLVLKALRRESLKASSLTRPGPMSCKNFLMPPLSIFRNLLRK